MNQEPVNSSMPDWFVGEPVPTPPPKRSGHKRIMVVLAVLLVIAGAATALSATIKPSTVVSCLDAAAYEEFTGEKADAELFDPTENFFTFPAKFLPTTANYDDFELPKNNDAIRAMGIFYSEHSSVPLTYTLTAQHPDDDNVTELAEARLNRLKGDLEGAGVASSSIVQRNISIPAANSSTASSDDDEEGDGDSDTITVTITTTKKCGE